jgi:endonuclease YncB( thermonuclease family)
MNKSKILIGGIVGLASIVGLAVGDADAATTRTRARVLSWVDGDTVRTTRGTIRLIGMDTPERGEECYRQATRSAGRMAPVGTRITLVRVLGRDNVDQYGRKLRYVQNGTIDVGYRQIKRGLADARYDSGSYGTHPRRPAYRRADANNPDRDCTPTPAPSPAPGCHPAYPDFCIAPPPPDLDCADIGTSFTVNHAYGDPHNFDSDGDGQGCDSY